MGNCLVTKLKEVVNNDNLLPIGGIVIGFNHDETPDYSKRHVTPNIMSGKSVTLSIVDNENAYFTDSTGQANYGRTKTISAGEQSKTMVSNHACKVCVESKYNLNGIILGPNEVFDINSFKYAGQGENSFAYFQMGNSNYVTGNVSSLNDMNFVAINLNNTKVIGDVSQLKVGTSIYSVFNFSNCNVYGTLNLSAGSCKGSIAINNTAIVTTTSALSEHDFSDINCSNNINVTGSLSSLGTLVNCGSFYFGGSGVQGTLESLVESLWSNNKRSSGCYIHAANPITFNNTYPGLLYCAFSDSGVEVRQGSPSGTVKGNYNGSAWTYNS